MALSCYQEKASQSLSIYAPEKGMTQTIMYALLHGEGRNIHRLYLNEAESFMINTCCTGSAPAIAGASHSTHWARFITCTALAGA